MWARTTDYPVLTHRIWEYRHSIQIIHNIVGGRMFPLTLKGLERAMRQLNK